MCRTMLAIALLVAFVLPGKAEPQDTKRASGLAFQAAEGTGLAEILTRRKAELEAQQGKPLTGHQWWLWGLGGFDYDLDGDTDLLVCIHGSTNGVILRNELEETGKLQFVNETKALGVDGFVPSTDNYPLVWDFDGDGYLDIAGLLNDSQTPCLLNRGGRQFDKAPFSLHPINYPDEIRDLNGDRYIDIAQSRGGQRTVFYYSAKTASFEKSEMPVEPRELPEALREEIERVKAKKDNRFIKLKFFDRDLNGDGRSDLLVRAFGSYSGERLGWYFLAGKNGEQEIATEKLGLPAQGAPVLAEDVDHDGDIDLLITSADDAGLYVNDGQGRFRMQAGELTDFVKQRCPYMHTVFGADLDHDGDQDLAVSNRRYGREKVFENVGGGEFKAVLSVRGWDADPLLLRDINNDGLLDVVVGGAEEKEDIGVYLNVTAQPGNACRLSTRCESPNLYAVGTRVDVFPAGTLGQANARTLFSQEAHLDGSPIHVGLGAADSFDLRVSFPGREPMEFKNVKSSPRLTVTPQGLERERGDKR